MTRPPAGRRTDGVSPVWRWIDLRLVPPAAAVWTTTLLAPAVPRPALLVAAAGATVLVLLLLWHPTPAGLVAALVLAGVAFTAVLVTVRTTVRDASPLREAAIGERDVTVLFQVSTAPQSVHGSRSPRMLLDGTVTGVQTGSGTAQVHDAVRLLAPEDWAGVTAGEVLRLRARATLPSTDEDVVAVLSGRGPPEPVAGPPWWQRAAGAVRQGLVASAHRVLPDAPAGLLPGLVVGDTSGLDPVLAQHFRTAGLTHLVAVSGANVAMVLAGVLWPLRRRGARRWLQAVVGGLALLGFVVLAQPGASVLRAAAMGGVGLVALASGRARAAVPALAGTVAGLVLVDPALARDAGFGLSVAATAAIVLLARPASAALRRRGTPAALADALAVSAAAGAATAPLIAALSGQVSLVSLPANLAAAPVVAPATVVGLIAAILAAALPPAADLVVWLAGWPVRWLVLVADTAARLPDAAARWPGGAGGAALLTLVLLSLATAVWRLPRLRPLLLAALVGALLLGWPLRQAVRGWPPSDADVIACDVGQGDALVVPTGPGRAVLVDTGPDPGAVDRCLQRLGVLEVPLVLLSHLDADHAAGLPGALAGRTVGEVATAALSPADGRGGRIDALASNVGARRSTFGPGERREIGTATVEVLAPPARRATVTARPNDLSMVVRVSQRGVRILFTGDLGAEAESRLLAQGLDLGADVLKVPHHGSADADPAFFAASGARLALISVGADNPYGHPAARTLARLAADGMEVHRTDREGDVAVVGSAGRWGVTALLPPEHRAARGTRPGGSLVPRAAVTDLPSGAAAAPLPADASADRLCRRQRVAACGHARRTSRAHLTAESRGGGGGAAAGTGRGRRPGRGARAPP